MRLKNILSRLLLGRERAETLRVARIIRSPDRVVLVDRYLPAFAKAGGRILWIGCQAYTADYPARLEAGGGEVWTLEFDAAAAVWGREGRHRTGDLKQAKTIFADMKFDTVLCNGVLGFGVDTPADQRTALSAMANVLNPGGRLLLGWNTNRILDPVSEGIVAHPFMPTALDGLPQRMTFPTVTHVFDLFERV